MATVIDYAGWRLDPKDGKEKFHITVECETKEDVPEFPISWVGKPVKVTIELAD